MPSTTDLVTLTLVLAALTTTTTSATVVGAATDGRNKVVRTRKLRRGNRQVTQIDNLDSITKKGGLEEDVEFWTNMVRKTQYMSLPPVPAPVPSLPPVVVEPPSFASEPPVGSGTVVPGPTPSSLPPVASSEPPVVSSLPPVVSSLPPVVSSEPPVVGSLPPVVASEPPIGTSSPPIPAPIPSLPPVVASEPPVISSSPPVGGGGGFICPEATFVGCTDVDPSNPKDECTNVGEPCPNGIDGEYCCVDACPRNYCTAKQAPMMTTAQVSDVEMFVAPLPNDF